MRKYLFSFFFISLFSVTYAQTQPDSYLIRKTGVSYTKEQISQAIEKADFTYYRLNANNRTIKFNDGSEVILLSRKELSLDSLIERFPDQNEYPTRFLISDNGYIVELYENTDKSKKGNY